MTTPTFLPGQTVLTNTNASAALAGRYGTVLELRAECVLVLLDGSPAPVLLRPATLVSASRPGRNLIDTLDS